MADHKPSAFDRLPDEILLMILDYAEIDYVEFWENERPVVEEGDDPRWPKRPDAEGKRFNALVLVNRRLSRLFLEVVAEKYYCVFYVTSNNKCQFPASLSSLPYLRRVVVIFGFHEVLSTLLLDRPIRPGDEEHDRAPDLEGFDYVPARIWQNDGKLALLEGDMRDATTPPIFLPFREVINILLINLETFLDSVTGVVNLAVMSTWRTWHRPSFEPIADPLYLELKVRRKLKRMVQSKPKLIAIMGGNKFFSNTVYGAGTSSQQADPIVVERLQEWRCVDLHLSPIDFCKPCELARKSAIGGEHWCTVDCLKEVGAFKVGSLRTRIENLRFAAHEEDAAMKLKHMAFRKNGSNASLRRCIQKNK